jgi:hypothetical protein
MSRARNSLTQVLLNDDRRRNAEGRRTEDDQDQIVSAKRFARVVLLANFASGTPRWFVSPTGCGAVIAPDTTRETLRTLCRARRAPTIWRDHGERVADQHIPRRIQKGMKGLVCY